MLKPHCAGAVHFETDEPNVSETSTFIWFRHAVHSFPSLGEHGLVVEYFKEIPGLEVAKLTSNKKYPNTPDEVQKIQVFETQQNRGDQYGARLRTYFMVR